MNKLTVKNHYPLPRINDLFGVNSIGFQLMSSKIDLRSGVSPLSVTRASHSKDGISRRGFIEGFSKIAKPMTKLTQKGIKFDWGEKEENAFQLIKQKLCSAPILALLKEAKAFSWSIVMLHTRA
ncbi:hypothetical protein Tco_0604127 [Tanacetum coccineum]